MCAKLSLLGDVPLCAKPVLVEPLLNAKTRLGEPVPTVCQDLHRCCRREVPKSSCQNIREQVRVGQPQMAYGTYRAFWELEPGTKNPGVRVTGKLPSVRGDQCLKTWEEVRLA